MLFRCFLCCGSADSATGSGSADFGLFKSMPQSSPTMSSMRLKLSIPMNSAMVLRSSSSANKDAGGGGARGCDAGI